MKKLISLVAAASLLIPVQAVAATTKPTPKPTTSKSKVVTPTATKKPATKKPVVKKPATKKPVVKKKVVKKKKKLPAKKVLKWPQPGFENKKLFAKSATDIEIGIAGTENKYIQKNLINYCHEVACGGIFVGSETGCDWWEITSNVLGVDPADLTQRIIYGSLTTLAPGSAAKKVTAILLISDEPIADGLGIGAYTANCRVGTPTEKIPSNTYTKSITRS
jgi:hypothetical protein